MHVFDLFAVAEDRRLAREREGRLERTARRMARVRPEPVAEKRCCPGAKQHTPSPSSVA